MLSKYKNRNEAWLISAAMHFLLASSVAWILWVNPQPNSVDLEVIESPTESPAATQKTLTLSKPKPKEPEKAKPRAVFGLSRKSVTSEDGLDTKAGNTVAKAPDKEKLRPGDADTLPIPVDEFLVNKMPKLKTEVRIPYPIEAKQKGIQGAVVMDLLIDGQGKVREIKFVSGPGFGLNEAALEAVKAFEFEPAEVEQKPVAVRIRYAYRFVLER